MTITEFKTEKATEYNVIDGPISLRQVEHNDGMRFTEVVKDTDFINLYSDEAYPLFIALINYKNGHRY